MRTLKPWRCSAYSAAFASLQRSRRPTLLFAENAGVVTDHLQELNSQGMQPDHLALLLESILRARRQNLAEEDLIDLVWTGPETSATLNRDTPVVVRDLFGRAEHSVLVVALRFTTAVRSSRVSQKECRNGPACRSEWF